MVSAVATWRLPTRRGMKQRREDIVGPEVRSVLHDSQKSDRASMLVQTNEEAWKSVQGEQLYSKTVLTAS
jgi:hypothetical protein